MWIGLGVFAVLAVVVVIVGAVAMKRQRDYGNHRGDIAGLHRDLDVLEVDLTEVRELPAPPDATSASVWRRRTARQMSGSRLPR